MAGGPKGEGLMENRSEKILTLLNQEFKPLKIELVDESSRHGGRQSHFKLFLVSEEFQGLGRLERQQRVNQLLSEEFKTGLHALTMRLLTEQEAERGGELQFKSPPCMGHKE